MLRNEEHDFNLKTKYLAVVYQIKTQWCFFCFLAEMHFPQVNVLLNWIMFFQDFSFYNHRVPFYVQESGKFLKHTIWNKNLIAFISLVCLLLLPSSLQTMMILCFRMNPFGKQSGWRPLIWRVPFPGCYKRRKNNFFRIRRKCDLW